MKPLLLVMNPRAITPCVEAIDQLVIDKVWLKNYTEAQLNTVIPEVLAECDHDTIGILSDDGIPTQAALDAVLAAYTPDAVYTGYCNLDSTTTLVNLSTAPLKIQHEATPDCYTLPTREEVDNWEAPLMRSWFTGFALMFMSRDLWEQYPFYAIGDPGVQSDYSLCRRLQEDEVTIWAVRGAWYEHLRREDLTTNGIEGGELRIDREPAEVVWDLRA